VPAIDDVNDFVAMDAALASCGLDETEKGQLYSLLTAMLLLGSIQIAKDASGDSILVTPESEPSLRKAEELLCIGNIQQLMIEKVVHSPRSKTEYHIALDLHAAETQRDALVKHM
jgi:myosin heavy subunit